MKFRFNINITEKDYIDFNVFCMINTPYGKKQIKQFRLINAIIIALGIVAVFLISGISAVSFAGAVIFLLMLFIVEFSAPKIITASAKSQVKLLKKSNKKFYSTASVMEFYDDYFTDTDEDAKTEQKYSSVERVSIVEGKVIYIHINDIRAYLIPKLSFDSREQYEAFVDFIKTKCNKTDVY